MLTEFFFKLKEGGVPVTIKEFLTLLEALRSHLIGGSLDEFYYLARVCLVKDETQFDRYDRVFAAYFKGIERAAGRSPGADPRGVAAPASGAAAVRRGEGADPVAGRLGEADGDAAPATGGAARAPSGRLQVDRHRRHLALRRLRLQPGGRAHRPGRLTQPQRGQSLGPARVPQPGRRGGAGNAQHQARAAAAAALRPRGRSRGAGSGRHDPLHRAGMRVGWT